MTWLHFTVCDFGDVDHKFVVDAKTLTIELYGTALFLGTLGVKEFETVTQATKAFERLLHDLEHDVPMITFPFDFESVMSYNMRDDSEEY